MDSCLLLCIHLNRKFFTNRIFLNRSGPPPCAKRNVGHTWRWFLLAYSEKLFEKVMSGFEYNLFLILKKNSQLWTLQQRKSLRKSTRTTQHPSSAQFPNISSKEHNNIFLKGNLQHNTANVQNMDRIYCTRAAGYKKMKRCNYKQ